MAWGQSWISSKIIRLLFGAMWSYPMVLAISSKMRRQSKSYSKMSFKIGFFSKLK